MRVPTCISAWSTTCPPGAIWDELPSFLVTHPCEVLDICLTVWGLLPFNSLSAVPVLHLVSLSLRVLTVFSAPLLLLVCFSRISVLHFQLIQCFVILHFHPPVSFVMMVSCWHPVSSGNTILSGSSGSVSLTAVRSCRLWFNPAHGTVPIMIFEALRRFCCPFQGLCLSHSLASCKVRCPSWVMLFPPLSSKG